MLYVKALENFLRDPFFALRTNDYYTLLVLRHDVYLQKAAYRHSICDVWVAYFSCGDCFLLMFWFHAEIYLITYMTTLCIAVIKPSDVLGCIHSGGNFHL